jgi:hypothetical protein
MFIEIFDCMRGDLKYIHMMDIEMFVNVVDVHSKNDILEYLYETKSIFLFRKNKIVSKYPNTYICSFIDRDLSLKNTIFIKYEEQFYKIKKNNLIELDNDKIKDYCEHQFPYATSFKHLVYKIINI